MELPGPLIAEFRYTLERWELPLGFVRRISDMRIGGCTARIVEFAQVHPEYCCKVYSSYDYRHMSSTRWP